MLCTRIFIVSVLLLMLSSCKKDKKTLNSVIVNDTFTSGNSGWVVNFADYPVGEEKFFELGTSISALPQPLDTMKKGLKLSRNNHSDDLFMYLYKRLSGLQPKQRYTASFTISFATNAPSDSFGVGGSPGESVYVGAGLSTVEPVRVVKDNYYRLNVGKINQSADGTAMKVIGNISNGKFESVYVQKQLTGTFTGDSDANGNLWLLVGSDSGYEAVTTLYYMNIEIVLHPAAA